MLTETSLGPSLAPRCSDGPLPVAYVYLSINVSPSCPCSLDETQLVVAPFVSLVLYSSPVTIGASLPTSRVSTFSLFLSFSLSICGDVKTFHPRDYFPIAVRVGLSRDFQLGLFLSCLRHVTFLNRLLNRESERRDLHQPLVRPIQERVILGAFNSLRDQSFEAQGGPSVGEFSLTIDSLPRVPC